VRVTVNEKKEGYNTSIWSVPVAGGEAPRQLTKGDHDTTPRWSPDGKFWKILLFLRSIEKLCHQRADADDVYPWRSRLSHAARRGGRANVSRLEVPEDSNSNGAFP
jgi:dipeptidyl aminopeptidase/acylaminoacyl peptidase